MLHESKAQALNLESGRGTGVHPGTLAVILAGGRGSRLEPLTRDRAKPAVPFGGQYRIIDFTLSNCLNSGLRQILVLTQYKASSLDRHINLGWRRFFCHDLNEFIDILPPQQRINEKWYQGTADAVHQNIYSLEQAAPRYVVILAGDHIYKMNYQKMVQFHIERQADVTVGSLEVSREAARAFGVMQVDRANRMIGFSEKPAHPQTIPGRDVCLASMGIYVFSSHVLFDQLFSDAQDELSDHDFGKNIIPKLIHTHKVYAFGFTDENRKEQIYWRDVGTVDAYHEANMDLISVDPQLDLYNQDWPIRTYMPGLPPAKFVFGSRREPDPSLPERKGQAIDSMVCGGCVISGGTVVRSIVGSGSRVNSYAEVRESILFDNVNVGRHARIQRAIIDKHVKIPPHFELGFDPEADRARGFTVSPEGVTVVCKSHNLESLPVTGQSRAPITAPHFHKSHKTGIRSKP